MRANTICGIIPIDGIGTIQAFHPKYLNGEGGDKKLFIDFAKEAHEQLVALNKCLVNIKKCFENEDKNTLKSIEQFLVQKRERIAGINRVLIELERGTFTLGCRKTDCEEHPNLGGECNADLTKQKFVMPEITTCVKMREKQELRTQQTMNA